MRLSHASFILAFALLGGCQVYPPTPTPDYTINVVKTPKGDQALAPDCPSFATAVQDPFDNQPLPQFGCASARNLALMVEQPSDLLQGRDLGPTRGVPMVGAVRRYDNNQTRGLIYPSAQPDAVVDVTTAPTPASPMTGDVTGGASSSSSSSTGATSLSTTSAPASGAAGGP